MRLTKPALKALKDMGECGKVAAETITDLRVQVHDLQKEISRLKKLLADAERPVRDQQLAIDRLKRRIHELETFDNEPITMGR